MTRIDVGNQKATMESNKPKFVFWNRTRFFVLFFSLLCMTLAQINSLTFNFTVICMNDVVQDSKTTNSSDVHWMESSSKKSLLFSAVAIGEIAGLIPSVPLIDRYGIRIVLTVYGFISAASSIFFPLSVSFNYYTVILCRVLQGFGTSILFTAVGVISGVWAPENEMGTFLAVLSTAFQMGSILAMSVSGVLCESHFGWRSIYYLFGVLTFLGFVVFYVLYKDEPRQHRHISLSELSKIQHEKVVAVKESVPYKAISTDITVIMAWLSVFGGDIGFIILMIYGPTYLRDVLHFDVKTTGFASALPYVLSALVKFSAGQLSDRCQFVSEKTRFTICAIISQFGLAAIFLVMAITSNQHVAHIAYTLAITIAGLNIMGTIKCVQLRCRQHVHFAVAVIGMMACLIQLLAPMGIGLLIKDNSEEQWSRLFIIISILIFAFNLPFPFFTSAEPGPYVKTVEEKTDSV